MGDEGSVFPSSGGLTPPRPFWIPAFAGMTNWGAGLTKGGREWRMRGCRSGLSRIGVRDMLS